MDLIWTAEGGWLRVRDQAGRLMKRSAGPWLICSTGRQA